MEISNLFPNKHNILQLHKTFFEHLHNLRCTHKKRVNRSTDRWIGGSADLVNILAQIVDSERNCNGSADLMITADRGFIQIMGPDFGFWLLGSSHCGSQRSLRNLTFSLL